MTAREVPGWLYTASTIGCLCFGMWVGYHDASERSAASLSACHAQMANSPIGPTVVLPETHHRMRLVCLSAEGCGNVTWQTAAEGEEFKALGAEAVR